MSDGISASGAQLTGDKVTIIMTVTTTFNIAEGMYPEHASDGKIIEIEQANIAADPASYVEMACEEGSVEAVVTVTRG